MRWMCHDVSASSRRKEGAVVRRDKGLESDWGREFTGCIQLAKLSPNTSPGICQDVAVSTLCSVSQGTCQAEEPDSETSPLPLPGSGSIHHHFEPLLAFILICLPFSTFDMFYLTVFSFEPCLLETKAAQTQLPIQKPGTLHGTLYAPL